MLRKRFLAAAVMVGLVAGMIVLDWQMFVRGKEYIPGIWILSLIVTILGCREFYRLASSGTVVPARWLGTGMAVLTVTVIWLLCVGPKIRETEAMQSRVIEWMASVFKGPGPVALCLGMSIALFFATRMTRRRATGTLVSVAVTLGGVVYVGVLVSFMILVSAQPYGPLRVATLLAVVKGSDVGAYFVGRWWGRHPLIPWVSPKKTWEGFAGALASGMLISFGLGEIWERVPGGAALLWWQRLLFGLVVSGVGHFGDLCESLMKRDAYMKDSGRDVPGFGGVLDVVDSPLIAGPFGFLLLVLFEGGA